MPRRLKRPSKTTKTKLSLLFRTQCPEMMARQFQLLSIQKRWPNRKLQSKNFSNCKRVTRLWLLPVWSMIKLLRIKRIRARITKAPCLSLRLARTRWVKAAKSRLRARNKWSIPIAYNCFNLLIRIYRTFYKTLKANYHNNNSYSSSKLLNNSNSSCHNSSKLRPPLNPWHHKWSKKLRHPRPKYQHSSNK